MRLLWTALALAAPRAAAAVPVAAAAAVAVAPVVAPAIAPAVAAGAAAAAAMALTAVSASEAAASAFARDGGIVEVARTAAETASSFMARIGAAAQDMSAAATSAAQIAVETGMMMGAYYGDKRTMLERTIEARKRFRERLGEISREQSQVEGPWLEGLINDATDKIKRLRAEEKANPGDGDLPTVGAFITAEQPTPAGTFTLPASAPTLATRAGGEPCPAEAAATTPGSSTVAAIAAGACVAGAIAMLALQQLGRRCCRSGGRPEIKRGSQMPQPPFSA